MHRALLQHLATGLLFCLTSACGATETPLPVPPEADGECSRQLLDALKRRDEGALKDLRKRGAVGDCARSTSDLNTAIRNNQLSDLEWLLKAGADPNGSNGHVRWPRSFLHAFEGHAFDGYGLEATRLLLKYGADPNQRGSYAWNQQSIRDESGKLHAFYEHKLEGATPLMAAAAVGKIEFAKMMLDQGADPDVRDAAGLTALDYAGRFERPEMAELLTRRSSK